MCADREFEKASPRRRTRHGKRRFSAPGLSFIVRWAFAVSAAMVVAGLIEYGVARQQIIDRRLEDYQIVLEVTEQAALNHADPIRTLRQA